MIGMVGLFIGMVSSASGMVSSTFRVVGLAFHMVGSAFGCNDQLSNGQTTVNIQIKSASACWITQVRNGHFNIVRLSA
jgi:hypothetical protein